MVRVRGQSFKRVLNRLVDGIPEGEARQRVSEVIATLTVEIGLRNVAKSQLDGTKISKISVDNEVAKAIFYSLKGKVQRNPQLRKKLKFTSSSD